MASIRKGLSWAGWALSALVAFVLGLFGATPPGWAARADSSHARQGGEAPAIRETPAADPFRDALREEGDLLQLAEQAAPEARGKVFPKVEMDTQPNQAMKAEPSQPRQALKAEQGLQPRQALKAEQGLQPRQALKAETGNQPRQAMKLGPARQPQQAEKVAPSGQPQQAAKIAPAGQPQQAAKIAPAGQPQQAAKIAPAPDVEPDDPGEGGGFGPKAP